MYDYSLHLSLIIYTHNLHYCEECWNTSIVCSTKRVVHWITNYCLWGAASKRNGCANKPLPHANLEDQINGMWKWGESTPHWGTLTILGILELLKRWQPHHVKMALGISRHLFSPMELPLHECQVANCLHWTVWTRWNVSQLGMNAISTMPNELSNCVMHIQQTLFSLIVGWRWWSNLKICTSIPC